MSSLTINETKSRDRCVEAVPVVFETRNTPTTYYCQFLIRLGLDSKTEICESILPVLLCICESIKIL